VGLGVVGRDGGDRFTPFDAQYSISASRSRCIIAPLCPRRTRPSTAARDSSNDAIVPERAVSSKVAPTFEPMRIEMLVDFENSDTIAATDVGSSVGPGDGV